MARELQGCTFVPEMATKKQETRDLEKFLQDQKRFEEEKRIK